MKMNVLDVADALSNDDLLERLPEIACRERESAAELVAHLAALAARPAVQAAKGYGSLFGYCTQALRLSEDVACNRIEVAQACRRFPLILELLASGSMNLTSARLVGRHLTEANCEVVLRRASGRSRREIEALVAELAPQADLRPSVRQLPASAVPPALSVTPALAVGSGPSEPTPGAAQAPPPVAAGGRSIVRASAAQRYRVQFTVGEATHQKFRRVQALLRREIPDGDVAAIFDRALSLLLAKAEKTKLAAVTTPRRPRPIRPRTDERGKASLHSRHIPSEVKRVVWQRDGGQCAYTSSAGRRCTECTFLEFHHVQPYANEGPATVENISLRCRRHNQYEAELMFGPHEASIASENSRTRPREGAPVQQAPEDGSLERGPYR